MVRRASPHGQRREAAIRCCKKAASRFYFGMSARGPTHGFSRVAITASCKTATRAQLYGLVVARIRENGAFFDAKRASHLDGEITSRRFRTRVCCVSDLQTRHGRKRECINDIFSTYHHLLRRVSQSCRMRFHVCLRTQRSVALTILFQDALFHRKRIFAGAGELQLVVTEARRALCCEEPLIFFR